MLTEKAAEDLLGALDNILPDKRDWSPGGTARTAHDQVAEVAILNGSTAELLKTKKFESNFDFEQFAKSKVELAKDPHGMKRMLDENTAKVIKAIQEVPDSELSVVVEMPWGPMTISQIMGYPFWNMCYHEGQINYIASILGTLP
jgi:uncharacterized damage-inducible protein DinB